MILKQARTIAVIALPLLAMAMPARADVLVDDVVGVTPDGKGGLERFTGLLIDDSGHIAALYRDKEKRPKKVAYKVDGKRRFVVPGMIDAHAHVIDTGFARMTLDLSPARSGCAAT